VNAPAWLCDQCRRPLDPVANDGSIYISYREWEDFRQADATWSRSHRSEDGILFSNLRDLVTAPTFHWHVEHDRCDQEPGRADLYWIEVGRVDSWAKVADWSAHLHGKQWFADTDWDSLLYRAGVGSVAA
jgi:hypothetical protein